MGKFRSDAVDKLGGLSRITQLLRASIFLTYANDRIWVF